jgi:class 3 adenylate cyclase
MEKPTDVSNAPDGPDPAAGVDRRSASNGRQEARKLAAIMFTDMVGFSRMMHQNEVEALRLLDEGNAIIAAAVSQYGGRILKTMGDAVLAEFPSAKSAVESAILIQSQLRDFNFGQPSDHQFVLRIGIHIGDVVIREQDLFGDGINVAARLEPLSEPGGICLSEAVYQAIAASSPIKPVLVGEVELKNILQRQVIYRIPAFYNLPASVGASQRARSLDSGAVGRIETLPPPRRGLGSAVIISAIVTPLSLFAGWLSAAFVDSVQQRYAIAAWEVVDAPMLVETLRSHADPASTRIWESLDRDARAALTDFDRDDVQDGNSRPDLYPVRQALNKLILSDQPVLDEPLSAELLGPAFSRADTHRLNRALVEATLSGSIQRYVGEPSIGFRLGQSLRTIRASPRSAMLLVAIFGMTFLGGAYMLSLTTLRIHFSDLRDVDVLLDYYIPELGFKQPTRASGELVFRATLWTWFLYTVLRVRAHVSGNTVLLTGPSPMMRRLKRRLTLLARPAASPRS